MNKKEAKETAAYRVRLFRAAANFQKPERIPHLSAAVTWKIFDAGESLPKALTDFSVMEKCQRHFLDSYKVDALMDIGIRNQFTITEAFGSPGYYYYNSESVGIHDHAFCTVDTLEEYLAEPEKYVWERVMPEKFGPDWDKKELAVWKKTFRAYMDYTRFIIHMSSVQKEYGIPSMAPNNPMKGAIQFGIEELEANILGIKQLSVAMRRNPDKIEDFCRRWDEEHIEPLVEKIKTLKGPDYKYCFDASMMMLAQNILNPKQFERYYWPSLSKLLHAYEDKGCNVRVFTEGEIGRYAEYFKDFKKGTLSFHLEGDDPFEFREKLPNVAIIGGMTTDMLSKATPEVCVEYAKKLCDELGREGGFIFSENKMLSFRNDATGENMAAVCEFLNGYEL